MSTFSLEDWVTPFKRGQDCGNFNALFSAPALMTVILASPPWRWAGSSFPKTGLEGQGSVQRSLCPPRCSLPIAGCCYVSPLNKHGFQADVSLGCGCWRLRVYLDGVPHCVGFHSCFCCLATVVAIDECYILPFRSLESLRNVLVFERKSIFFLFR